MAVTLSPYLNFNGQARDAMTFYQLVFGGDLRLSTFGEYGAPEGVDPEWVMHGQLETPLGWTLMASDYWKELGANSGHSTNALFGDDAELIQSFFNALADGGEVTMPFEKQVWGDHYGAANDKFGVPWMFNASTAAGDHAAE